MTIKQFTLCLMIVSFPAHALQRQLIAFYQAASKGESVRCMEMLRNNAALYKHVTAQSAQVSMNVQSILYDFEEEKKAEQARLACICMLENDSTDGED